MCACVSVRERKREKKLTNVCVCERREMTLVVEWTGARPEGTNTVKGSGFDFGERSTRHFQQRGSNIQKIERVGTLASFRGKVWDPYGVEHRN